MQIKITVWHFVVNVVKSLFPIPLPYLFIPSTAVFYVDFHGLARTLHQPQPGGHFEMKNEAINLLFFINACN